MPKLSPAQRTLLANVEATSMYGPNARTFDKLINLGLIERKRDADFMSTPYRRTDAGDALVAEIATPRELELIAARKRRAAELSAR